MSNWNTKPNGRLSDRLERIVRADSHLMHLLNVLRGLDLPQWRVAAGCIYQAVWNALTDRPRGTGIRDYDVIYFDGDDLSRESELAVERSVRNGVPTAPASAEVRNQARVHLWFEESYGVSCAPLSCADESITRYPSVTHAVAVCLTDDDRLDVFAPFGLDDIFAMIVRPNHILPNKTVYERKAARAKAVWPELTVIPWS
jgi:hypothetical protein